MTRFTRLLRLLLALACLAAGSHGASAAGAQAAAGVVAADVALESDAGRTRFRITLSREVAVQTHVMERPDRLIVDLPEVTFHLPPESGRKPSGLVSSYRYGLFAPGRSRVVMDLAQPATVSAIRTEPGAFAGAVVLVIELTRTDRDTFRKAAALNASAAQAQPGEGGGAAQAAQDRRPVIVIDPGHGGIDPGANALTGAYEKDIVLGFARSLKKQLEAKGLYRVVLTRDQDVFVSLGDRVRAARAARADLFISIHADSISGGQEVRGLTVYTGSERASDADSAQLADRENRADAAAGVDAGDGADEVSDILQDLTLRETRSFSHRFAGSLVGELVSVARLNKNPRREAGFRVLRAYDVPSVLVELGYLSSRQDLDLLMSEEWRGKATAAMAVAVDRFFATRLARQGAAAVLP
ncbi:N-acetylmuramoyl-L-alanine amidase [Microvirga thermotolerans]|uniref:N-acetylmuramoyl-L-alanine amidase n=1 Tax=Microvirga thermotolerans TaxID=2651334 RepID=A0A5P9JYM2_9HYPH|nr:N-acetylmuramoyl-L-alanine amidase [Microvirga thermotolerans]QFU16355.1 AMIN domain-containing protein [Microvirga thermotolerans]